MLNDNEIKKIISIIFDDIHDHEMNNINEQNIYEIIADYNDMIDVICDLKEIPLNDIFYSYISYYILLYEICISNNNAKILNKIENNLYDENKYIDTTLGKIIGAHYHEIQNILNTYDEKNNYINILKDRGITKNDVGKKKEEVYDIIIREYFFKEIYDLEKLNNEIYREIYNKESIYIDVVRSSSTEITIESINNILNRNEKSLLSYLYNFVVNESKTKNTDSLKINSIFSNNLIIPIGNDFMLYNKKGERYDQTKTSKIKYILNKINMATELNSSNISESTKNKKINNLFVEELKHIRAITINSYEDIKIINKLQNQIFDMNMELYSDYKEFLSYNNYPYVNFKEEVQKYYNYGYENIMIDILRSISLENDNRLQFRVSGNNDIHMVGLLLCPHYDHKFILKKKNIHYAKYENMDKFLSSTSGMTKRKDRYEYIIFNDYEEDTRIFLLRLYEKIMSNLYDDCIEKLKKNNTTNILKSIRKKDCIIEKYYNLHISENISEKLRFYLFYINNEYKKIIKEIDVRKKIYNLPIYKPKIEISKRKRIEERKIECYHLIYLKYFFTFDKNSYNIFLNRFCKYNYQNELICINCGQNINSMNNYIDVKDGKINTEDDSLNFVNIHENKEYEKYMRTIEYMEDISEKLVLLTNIKYYINSSTEKINMTSSKIIEKRKQMMISKYIDIVKKNNTILQAADNIDYDKYGININISDMRIFDMNDELIMKCKKDIGNKDANINIIKNNIIAYLIVILLNEINYHQIMSIHSNKNCNRMIYEKYGIKFFSKIKIIYNFDGDIKNITEYPLLCYFIFMMSCNLYYGKLWIYEDKSKFIYIIFKIISTITSILISILENKNNALLGTYCSIFIIKLNNLYNEQLSNLTIKKEEKKERKIINLDHDVFINKSIGNVYKMGRKDKMKDFKLSKITNCKDGFFHLWEEKNGVHKCKLCGVILSEIYNQKENNSDIIKNVTEIAKKNKKILDKQIIKMDKNVCSYNVDYKSHYDKFYELFGKNNVYFIDKFADNIKKYIGQSNINISLDDDIYVISNDKNGNIIKKKTIDRMNITYDDNFKINNLNNNMGVIKVLIDKIYLLYDKETLHYIGFVNNKEVILNTKKDVKLGKINSLRTIITNITGKNNTYLKLKNVVNFIRKLYFKIKNDISNEYLDDHYVELNINVEELKNIKIDSTFMNNSYYILENNKQNCNNKNIRYYILYIIIENINNLINMNEDIKMKINIINSFINIVSYYYNINNEVNMLYKHIDTLNDKVNTEISRKKKEDNQTSKNKEEVDLYDSMDVSFDPDEDPEVAHNDMFGLDD